MAAMSVREVPTRQGPARLHRTGRSPRGAATLVLGHGAGGGIDALDLQALARSVAAAGHAVVLVEQPWRVAERRLAPRPAALDEAWLDAVRALRPGGPVVLGGRSAGARVACRTAPALGAAAVVALAFPLHPPTRPERSRAEELRSCPVPVMVVQGDRDPFGTADEVRRAAGRRGAGVRVVPVPGGDHGLARVDLDAAAAAVIAVLGEVRE